MRFSDDNRIVMTLDAGGTNFVFSAVRAENEIIDPIRYSAKGENIEETLKKLIDGFRQVENQLDETFVRPCLVATKGLIWGNL